MRIGSSFRDKRRAADGPVRVHAVMTINNLNGRKKFADRSAPGQARF
jgi:hypothetical protein